MMGAASDIDLTQFTSGGTKFPCTSPTDALPPEILVQIFNFLAGRPSADTGSISYDSPSFSSPLLLGKICGRWRELAWSTPSLWNHIDLVLPFSKSAIFTDLLHNWIRRSVNLPLTIIFRRDEIGARGAARNWGEQTLPLFHLIAKEYHRWERVDLFIPHGFCALRMNNICESLPFLRSAVLRGVRGAASPNYTFLRNCPQLEELSIHLIQFQSPSAPYAQLIMLTASEMSMCALIPILTQTPNLQSLFLADISATTASMHSAPGTILLDKLNSLTVSNVRAVAYLLDGIQAPQLKSLRIDGDRVPLESRSIQLFIQKHGPFLQSLTVTGIGKECIAALLSYVPSLKELNVRGNGFEPTKAFFASLTESLENLPELQCFCLSGFREHFDPLVHFVKHRWVQEYRPSKSDSLSASNCPSKKLVEDLYFSRIKSDSCS